MSRGEFSSEFLHYFVKLPFFALNISARKFTSLSDISRICPSGPGTAALAEAVARARRRHTFLQHHDLHGLTASYKAVNAVRYADVFIYPLLSRRTLPWFNEFRNLHLLAEAYENGPVLLLYAHTGSYYQTIAASAVLGYRVYPLAFEDDVAPMKKPFRWLFLLNMRLSERLFSGGRYLYSDTPGFAFSLKQIVSHEHRGVLYAAIDLPPSLRQLKRCEVPFLDGRTALPYSIVDFFLRRRLPIIIGHSSVAIIGERLKRVLHFEVIPECLTARDVLAHYAARLGEFIVRHPEQALNLINLETFYV